MVRSYLDENIAVELREILNQLSHDAAHSYDLGNRSISDPEHLLAAAETERILVTYNRRDFEPLHQFWTALNSWGILSQSHAGILAPLGEISIDIWSGLVHDFVSRRQDLRNQMWVWWRQRGEWRQLR